MLSRTIMRAIRVAQFGGVENLKVEADVPVPKPGDNEVLIRVKCAGVNPIDTYIRSGNFGVKPPLPYTPGMDSAGIVEEVGSKVTNFKKGDRVFTMRSETGTYAEYTVANELYTAKLLDNLSFAQGAGIGIPYYTAYRALHINGSVKKEDTILVHGASGAVGMATTQMAKAFGMRVFGTAGTPEGMELVKKTGADAVFNHRQEGYMEQIMRETGDQGVNVILECLANVNLLKDLELLANRGKVLVVGNRGTIEIDPRLTMMKESSIIGVALMKSTEAEWKQTHGPMEAGQKAGWLVPLVFKEYPLSLASQAHYDVINKTSSAGKLVINLNL